MSVDTIQTIGIIGSLVVATASIIVSIWQSRLQTKALESATYAQLQSRVDALNAFLIDHRDLLAELYPQVGQDHEPAFTVRALIMDRFLSLFEEIYTQKHKYHLLDDDVWQAWVRTMEVTLDQGPQARDHWRANRSMYPSGFRAFIDDLMTGDPSEGPEADLAKAR
jgi:hypothetical protein